MRMKLLCWWCPNYLRAAFLPEAGPRIDVSADTSTDELLGTLCCCLVYLSVFYHTHDSRNATGQCCWNMVGNSGTDH